MVAITRTLKVGALEDAFMGPVQNQIQYDRVNSLLDEIEQEGLNIAIGDRAVSKPGYFINPTIIDNPPDDSKIVAEEPFGEFRIPCCLRVPPDSLAKYATNI
jgi:acyl-CoA reductase-like NAD-dependent aldehyde dehydrogenase